MAFNNSKESQAGATRTKRLAVDNPRMTRGFGDSGARAPLRESDETSADSYAEKQSHRDQADDLGPE